MSERLIRAAIALCWSESGFVDQLAGKTHIYDPWPELDMVANALDELRPDWRQAGPPPSAVREDFEDEGEWTEDGRLLLTPVYYDDPERVFLALLLVGNVAVTDAEVVGWTSGQRRLAAEWALTSYAAASDNEGVVVPPRPEFIRRPGRG